MNSSPIPTAPRTRITALGLAIALSGAAAPVAVQSHCSHGSHDSHATAPAASAAKPAESAEVWTSAEVRRIDKPGKKLTLRHEPIKHLDMPAMTMVFRVQDAALLDRVTVGERVRFQVKLEDGNYVVTALEAEHK